MIRRSDTQACEYRRTISVPLREFIVGSIHLPWKTRVHELKGRAKIKISLSTGDEKIANRRRDQVHAQVEALVERAEERVAAKNRAQVAQMVGELADADIQRMIGQLSHDILAADDRRAMRPQEQSNVGGVIRQILSRGDQPIPSNTRIEQFAQNVERRDAERLLTDPEHFDSPILEGESNIPAALENQLLALRHGAGDKTKTYPAALAAIEMCLREVNVIPSPVTAALADNGMAMAERHPDRESLSFAMLRAKVDAHRTIEARRHGATTQTPVRPEQLVPEPVGPTISEARKQWIHLKKPKQKAQDDNRLYVDAFIGMFGDLPVVQVKGHMISAFRDKLAKRPRNLPEKIRSLSLEDQVAWAEGKTLRLLTPNTVNAKGIGSLSAILQTAVGEEWISANVCASKLLPVDGYAEDRLPYSTADLNQIFSSPVYAEGKRWKAGCGIAAFLMPIIGLFTGARLEEIGQLLVDDILCEEEIWYFNFTDIDDAAETAGEKPRPKNSKSKASRRQVPLHRFLIEIGFLLYVQKMKAKGFTYLFPELNPYRGVRTKNWSRWWGRYTDKFVTLSTRKVFHSFRHLFQQKIRNMEGVDEDVVKALSGHIKHMYAEAIDLKKRAGFIDRLAFPGLDLSYVRAQAVRLLGEDRA